MNNDTPIRGATIVRRDPPILDITPADVERLQRSGAPRDLVKFAQRHVSRRPAPSETSAP